MITWSSSLFIMFRRNFTTQYMQKSSLHVLAHFCGDGSDERSGVSLRIIVIVTYMCESICVSLYFQVVQTLVIRRIHTNHLQVYWSLAFCFSSEWDISIQGYMLKDFFLNSIRNEHIHPRLCSQGFLIQFNKKWAFSIQGYILKESLLNSLRNELCPPKAIFSRILYWI